MYKEPNVHRPIDQSHTWPSSTRDWKNMQQQNLFCCNIPSVWWAKLEGGWAVRSWAGPNFIPVFLEGAASSFCAGCCCALSLFYRTLRREHSSASESCAAPWLLPLTCSGLGNYIEDDHQWNQSRGASIRGLWQTPLLPSTMSAVLKAEKRAKDLLQSILQV